MGSKRDGAVWELDVMDSSGMHGDAIPLPLSDMPLSLLGLTAAKQLPWV